LQLSRRLL